MQRWSTPPGCCNLGSVRGPTATSLLRRPQTRFISSAASSSTAYTKDASRPNRQSSSHASKVTRPSAKENNALSWKLSHNTNLLLRSNLLKRDPSVLANAVKDALGNLKNKFKNKDFKRNGTAKQCYRLDPKGEYLPSFEHRVLAAFVPNQTLKDDIPLERSVVDECKNAWLVGRPAIIITALLDAYVHHIMIKTGYDKPDKLDALMEELQHPAEFYPNARAIQRHIHLHVGPTNSGKTYNALKRLEQAKSGFYAGPLRLLAQEVYSRFKSKGIPCGLVTGDTVKDMDDLPAISSHTVEMTPTGKPVDVGVIDEIQMLGDKSRGWAWTMALMGAQAKELHLCGEDRVVPLIEELVASMGDTLHIHRYERLNGLKSMSTSLKGNLKNLRKGDCVVCFSILGLHTMKKDIEEATGRNCAIVYGSLPPDIRAQQAQLFNEPDNTFDYLVASDAIGMGLNLAVKRIIFESVHKYDGASVRPIEVPHLKQIAGRAGRYRSAHEATSRLDQSDSKNEVPENTTPQDATPMNAKPQNSGPEVNDFAQSLAAKLMPRHETNSSPNPKSSGKSVGLVTTLRDEDLPYVQASLDKAPPPLKAAGLHPPGYLIARYAAMLPPATPFVYIVKRLFDILSLNPRFFLCDCRDIHNISRVIEGIDGLSIQDKLIIGSSPAIYKDKESTAILYELASCIGSRKKAHLLDLKEMPLEILDQPVVGEKRELANLVHLHKGLSLYMWLSYRFPDVFEKREVTEHALDLAEETMQRVLSKLSVDPNIRYKLMKKERLRSKTLLEDTEMLEKILNSETASDSEQAVQINWEDLTKFTGDATMDKLPEGQAASNAAV